MKRIFLGGTCTEGTTWREEIIPLLEKAGLEYFNPVVAKGDWDEAAQQNELNERNGCDFTTYKKKKKMTGVYSVAEAVDDSNKRPEKVILIVLEKDGDDSFDEAQMDSLESVGLMVERNGGFYGKSLEAAVLFMYHSTDTVIDDVPHVDDVVTEEITPATEALNKAFTEPWIKLYTK